MLIWESEIDRVNIHHRLNLGHQIGSLPLKIFKCKILKGILEFQNLVQFKAYWISLDFKSFNLYIGGIVIRSENCFSHSIFYVFPSLCLYFAFGSFRFLVTVHLIGRLILFSLSFLL
ncbi:hypothetical protein AAC387_Pa03g1228 [Persea americana]